ncbi:site-specific integrase [Microbacterium luticocti]|uniref:site-specific integrase n=1 Tax=Microbacterium luticocti TaxID=451764 RepID=UPI00040A5250
MRDLTRATLVYTLAYTGVRWGECVALRVRDRNQLKRRLHVRRNAVEVEGKIELGAPKSWEKRTVPYPAFLDTLLDALCNGKGPDDLIFPSDLDGYQRRPTTAEDSTSWYRLASTRAGLERLTLHDLRHTAASLAVASGAHVKVVQKMLGHESAAMTLDTYADLFDGNLDDIAERMDTRGAQYAATVLAAVGVAA